MAMHTCVKVHADTSRDPIEPCKPSNESSAARWSLRDGISRDMDTAASEAATEAEGRAAATAARRRQQVKQLDGSDDSCDGCPMRRLRCVAVRNVGLRHMRKVDFETVKNRVEVITHVI